MSDNISLEMPLRSSCTVLSKFKTIGDLRKNYPRLKIMKYIYLDPSDGKLKGVQPPDEIPLVENAYITVNGPLDKIHDFTIDASPKEWAMRLQSS